MSKHKSGLGLMLCVIKDYFTLSCNRFNYWD